MRASPIALAALAALLLSACGERDARPEAERRDTVPVGTDLTPPRGAPETGSLGVPGQEPDTLLLVDPAQDTVR